MQRRLLKVAFLGKLGAGGQEEQLARTARAMSAHADVGLISDDPGIRISLEGFNVAHVFHSSDGLCLARLQAGQRHRCATAYSTIWWPPEPTMDYATRLGMYTAHESAMYCSRTRAMYAGFLGQADVLLPNSRREAEELMKVGGMHGAMFPVVNAAPPELLTAAPSLALPPGGRGAIILCAGRLEPRKNQLALIQAFQLARLEGWRLVLAGSVTHDPVYASMCRRAADGWDGIEFAGELPQPELWALMARCAVYAQPSWAETPGLASIEAGLLGCCLVCGDGSTKEAFGPFADYCEPGRVGMIAGALQQAARQGPLSAGQQEAQRDHLSTLTWERAALQTAHAYLQAMVSAPDWRARLGEVRVAAPAGAVAIFSGAGAWDTGGGQRTAQLAREFARAGILSVLVQVPGVPPAMLHDFVVAQEERAFDLLAAVDAARRLAVIAVPFPSYASTAARLREAGWRVAYDLLDDWEGFRDMGQGDWYDANAERALVGTADAVVATSRALQARAVELGASAAARVPNGYAPQSAEAQGGRLARGTVTVAYLGTLYGRWLDWGLLTAICDARPDWTINLIGPDRPRDAPVRPNLCYIGPVPHEAVGAWLRQADVGIVPFAAGRVAAAVSPVKAYDYLAAGLPVVATQGMDDLAGMPGVVFAATLEEWLAQIEHGAASPLSEGEQEAALVGATWRERAAAFLEAAGW